MLDALRYFLQVVLDTLHYFLQVVLDTLIIFYNEKIGTSFLNEVPILVPYTHNHLIYRCDCDRRRIASKTRGQKRSLFKIFENSKIEHIRMTGTKIQVVVELSGKEMVKK